MKPKTAGRTTGRCHDANPIRAVDTAVCQAARTQMCGITADATVVTMDGLRRVRDLHAGDRLVTRNQGAVPLTSIEQHSIVTRAVYVIAGYMGHRQPDRDTLLPAAQTVHIRDWRARILGNTDGMLVTAQCIVDGEYVRDIGFVPLTVYRLYCERPQIIYADGMELGTAGALATPLKTAPTLYPS